jgi:hypothetical protein
MGGASTTTERGDTEAQEGAGAGAVAGTVLGGISRWNTYDIETGRRLLASVSFFIPVLKAEKAYF